VGSRRRAVSVGWYGGLVASKERRRRSAEGLDWQGPAAGDGDDARAWLRGDVHAAEDTDGGSER
jgi:hypothetical protein